MTRFALIGTLVLGVVACGPKPAPAPVSPPPPAATAAPTLPPPPPAPPAPAPAPECRLLGEGCQAKAGDSFRVADLASVELPAGWTYARTDSLVLATSADGAAALGFTTGTGNTKENIWQALRSLFEALGISGVVEQGVNLDKPQAQWPGRSFEVAVWQVEKPASGRSAQEKDPLMHGQPGALLIGVGRLANEKIVVGVGFQLRAGANAYVTQIKSSITSVRALTDAEG
jgi:hypothetical protein